MQLTKKDVVSIVGLIKTNYARDFRDSTKESLLAMIDSWFCSLARFDKEVVVAAFQRVLENCKYPPTLADIMEQIREIKKATESTETELWAELNKVLKEVDSCVYRFAYNAVDPNGLTQGQNARNRVNEIWEQLPPVLKEYCGDKNGLISLSKLDYEELGFEKGRFLKMIPTLKGRIEVKETINPKVLQIVSSQTKLLTELELLPLKDTNN